MVREIMLKDHLLVKKRQSIFLSFSFFYLSIYLKISPLSHTGKPKTRKASPFSTEVLLLFPPSSSFLVASDSPEVPPPLVPPY
jgi:hypothetical protein